MFECIDFVFLLFLLRNKIALGFLFVPFGSLNVFVEITHLKEHCFVIG